MNNLSIIVILTGIIVLIPIIFLSLECIIAVINIPYLNVKYNYGDYTPSTTVLVPAHNESLNIQRTLSSIINDLDSPKQIIVIADNCQDDTADLARQMGVNVLERFSEEQRGKGYAMAYGLQSLEANPPEIVVMIDADCTVKKKTINRIASLAWSSQRPVQAIYIMDVPPDPTTKDIISAFAIIIKNSVRQLGLTKLKLPCLLTGSGMAFPWQVIKTVSLANSKTTDDMQLGIDLAIAGYSPLHCHSGKVIGRLMEPQFATSQRSRWEHGHLDTLVTQTPRLIKEAIAQKRYDLFTLALELAVPPVSLLILIWLGITLIATLIGILFQNWLALELQLISGGILFLAFFLAWYQFGQEIISFKKLLMIPFYIIWKIPMYIIFFISPQKEWLRTERDS